MSKVSFLLSIGTILYGVLFLDTLDFLLGNFYAIFCYHLQLNLQLHGQHILNSEQAEMEDICSSHSCGLLVERVSETMSSKVVGTRPLDRIISSIVSSIKLRIYHCSWNWTIRGSAQNLSNYLTWEQCTIIGVKTRII